MRLIVLFNKPYGVLSQFTDDSGRPTLSEYIDLKNVYPAGRLDYDSEGLLVLTDDGRIQHLLANPKNKKPKTYWSQVEGEPTEEAIAQLSRGVLIEEKITLPAKAKKLSEPDLWDRNPPIRFRKSIPTSWIELTITEGRNRQVRKMTAAVGYPTLRLVRVSVGKYSLADLKPGEWKIL